MEARAGKVIRRGEEYEHLFPRPSLKTITIKNKAEVADTVALIQHTVPLTLSDTEKIAPLLKGKNLAETCRNIWDFVYWHIAYKRDEAGIEQVRRPARTWRDRKTGVDCDCMTEFISSILMNLSIPHKYRITIYNYDTGFQHIYVVVPKSGKLNGRLDEREDYIVLDTVKDRYDDEQPYLEYKDYNMKLELLNGLEGDESEDILSSINGRDIEHTDALELGDIFDEEELMGELGKVRKTKVGKFLKKVGDKAGKGIRAVNKVANPATILLRNGFLASMKLNIGNVGKRLRFAYMTDQQARAKGMNLTALNQIRKIKDKAETIFWQAGGKKENFRNAILKGKGNSDRMVALAGFEGLEGDEELFGELGEPISAVAITAASGTIAAIGAALSQVKGLFPNKNTEKAAFAEGQAAPQTAANMEIEYLDTPVSPAATSPTRVLRQGINTNYMTNSFARQAATGSSLPATNSSEEKPGFFKNSLTWVKENPGKSLLVAGAVVGGVLYLKARQGAKKYPFKVKGLNGNLSGVPRASRKKKKGGKSKPRSSKKSTVVKLSEIKLK